jgi:outer membrane protein OmpA-like peptidoglycan-associated protein
MKTKIVVPAALVVALSAATTGTALAQENTDQSYLRHHVDPPTSALELTIGTGYTEGFGTLANNVGMPSVAQEGMSFDFGVGYRLSPHWSIGAMGEYQKLAAERSSAIDGAVAGFEAAYHLAPYRRVDPWISLGTGYRWLWEVYHDSPPNTPVNGKTPQVLTQGIDAARLLVGMDLRVSQELAVGPFIGADLTVFTSQNVSAVNNPGVAPFVHAGLVGRFDIGAFDHRRPATPEPDLVEVGVTAPQPPAPVVVEPPPVAVEAPPPPPPIVEERIRIIYLSPSVSVSSDIMDACKLKLGDSSQFSFDDSKLTTADRNALDSVARCFTTGPMKDQNMDIVGRADPRGTKDYNLALGERRATSVGGYLALHGVQAGRIQKSSRGALDAEGTDEASWANDRRVDITLAK